MKRHFISLAPGVMMAVLLPAFLSGVACGLTRLSGPKPTGTPEQPVEMPTLPQPAESLPPTATPLPTQPVAGFRGVSFSYDLSLASYVNAQVMPAVQAEGNPPWMIEPEHLQFTFVDYVLQDTFHEPSIYVYPVAEFEAMSENAVQIIDEMHQLLAQKPARPEESIPFLPIWNAGQFLQAGVSYFDFQNGSGVRFLTQYGQAVWPVNNQDLFYTYQGMTQDGGYYLAVILPLSHPSLPATGDEYMAGVDFDSFAENYEAYLGDIEGQLSAQAPESFVPDLSTLDTLVGSVRIEGW